MHLFVGYQMHHVLMANYNTTIHEGVRTSEAISMYNIQQDRGKFPIGQVWRPALVPNGQR